MWLSYGRGTTENSELSCFVQLNSSTNLVPLSLASSQARRGWFELGQFSLTRKALSTVVFCPKKRWPYLSMGLEKAFGLQEGSCFDFCDLNLTQSQEKTFLYSTFNFWVQNAIFHWHYYLLIDAF